MAVNPAGEKRRRCLLCDREITKEEGTAPGHSLRQLKDRCCYDCGKGLEDAANGRRNA